MLDELRRLQLVGVRQLPELIAWCWDQADNTGDARFCGVARALEGILEAWDVKGGLPEHTITDMNRVLREHLEDILSAPEAIIGSDRARWMRSEIGQVLHGESLS